MVNFQSDEFSLSVSERMKKIEQYLKDRSDFPSSDFPNDYKFLNEIMDFCSDFKRFLSYIYRIVM